MKPRCILNEMTRDGPEPATFHRCIIASRYGVAVATRYFSTNASVA